MGRCVGVADSSRHRIGSDFETDTSLEPAMLSISRGLIFIPRSITSLWLVLL